LNDEEVLRYRPGRTSCEPFRHYNTQGNGIYGQNPRTDANWQSFSNWCPGDVIDTRIIKLGALSAGEYKFTITVPDAIFAGGQGNFPLSLYFMGKTSGMIAENPKAYTISGHITTHDRKPVSTMMVMYPGSFSATNAAGKYSAIVDSNQTVTITPVLRNQIGTNDFTGFLFFPSSTITCTNVANDIFGQDFRVISTNAVISGITVLSSDTTLISSDTTLLVGNRLRITDSFLISQVLEVIDTIIIFGEITNITPPYTKERTDTLVITRTVTNTEILDITNDTPFVNVYPNPVFTELHVELATQETVEYTIYNATGQLVLQGKLQNLSTINVQSLSVGIYYLKIVGQETATVKFIKQ
jgi:hypothetical protein